MGNKPTHKVYSVREYEKGGEKKGHWHELGVGFVHKDGKGFDITLQATPIDGRLVCRLIERDKELPDTRPPEYQND